MEFIKTASFENQFWLQILGDHARFIASSLSYQEKNKIEKAQDFIQNFDDLLNESRRSLQKNQWISLTEKGVEAAEQLKAFKLQILKEQLIRDVKIQLPPTFLNHMVNELDEYVRIGRNLIKGEIPPLMHEIHHHLIWLLDAAGHAGAISSDLDGVEYKLKEKAQKFQKDFEQFYLKAIELAGFLRANISEFPALNRFNKEVNLEMEIFMSFLNELEELKINKEMLAVLTPLMADHMAREECYYLIKLSESAKIIPSPKCDPTRPRISEITPK